MKKNPKATKEQLEIAKEFHIPSKQAHLINLSKAEEYKKYLASSQAKDEQYLKSLEVKCV